MLSLEAQNSTGNNAAKIELLAHVSDHLMHVLRPTKKHYYTRSIILGCCRAYVAIEGPSVAFGFCVRPEDFLSYCSGSL